MSTSNADKDLILGKLQVIPQEVTCRPMMGEFLLYIDGVHVGGIYDGKVLLKEAPGNENLELKKVKPYAGAKRTMFYLEDLDSPEAVKEILTVTFRSVPRKKKV